MLRDFFKNPHHLLMVLYLGAALALLPAFAFAADATLQSIIVAFTKFIRILLPIAVSIAVLVFFWGVARFILKSGSPEEVSEGRQLMIWGVVALFVLVSIWGLVAALGVMFGVEFGGTCPPPAIGESSVSTCDNINGW